MSQEKVDRRKYEKKNRKQLERKRRIRTAVKCITAALVVGAAIGVPAGIKIYREQPKFVGDRTVGAFIASYIDEKYASEISGLGKKEDAEENSTTENEVTKVIENATGGDVKEVDEEDLDKALQADDSETEDKENNGSSSEEESGGE